MKDPMVPTLKGWDALEVDGLLVLKFDRGPANGGVIALTWEEEQAQELADVLNSWLAGEGVPVATEDDE